MSGIPKPPSGLGTSGRALWRRVCGDVADGWELDARDLAILESAARAADRVFELDQLVRTDGLMIRGSTGQERLHPAVGEARMQRQLCAMQLGRVELAPPKARTGHLNVRQRAELRRLQAGPNGPAI